MTQDLERNYKILGLGQEAGPREIKAAFRRLARRLHPDLNPDVPEAAARFQEAKQACDLVLDATLPQEAAARAESAKERPAPESELDWRVIHVEKEGLDVVYDLEVDAGVVSQGGVARVPHRHDQACPDCQGRGERRRWSWARLGFEVTACTRCRGTGRLERVQPIRVHIPAGLGSGDRLRVPSRGHLDARSGRRGDLLLRIRPAALKAA